MTPEINTKGQSKITAAEVIHLRQTKVANPDMTAQELKDKLNLSISTIMVGRALRGISHGHLDMCGLEIRPFQHSGVIAARIERKAAKRAAKAEAKAAEPVVEPVVEPINYVVEKGAKGLVFTAAQVAEIKRLAQSGTPRKEIAALFGLSLSSVARQL